MSTINFKLIFSILFCGLYSVLGATEKNDYQTSSTQGLHRTHDHLSSTKEPYAANELLNLDLLEENIKKAEQVVHSQIMQHSSETRVLVLGLTGSGKSTLVHALAGRDLYVERGASSLKIDARPQDLIPGYAVGHGLSSETSIPCAFFDSRTNLVYWDCPGFLDSRGVEQEIVNAFAIDYILKSPSQVKILLAMQESEFQQRRGQSALDRIEKIIGLIPEVDQLKKCLSLVVTHKHDQFLSVNKVRRLLSDLEFEYKEHVQQGIDQIDADIFLKSIDLLTYLVNTEEKIFSFPSPLQEGPYPITLFQDKNQLIQSLKRDAIRDPSHTFYLDPEALIGINQMLEKCGNVGGILCEFMSIIRKEYHAQTLNTCKTWQGFLSQLLDYLENNRSEITVMHLKEHIQINFPLSLKSHISLRTLPERLESAQRYVDFVQNFGYQKIHELNIYGFLTPLVNDLQSEINTFIQNQTYIQEQESKIISLQNSIEEERKQIKLNKEKSRQELQDLSFKIQKDKENINNEIQRAEAEIERIKKTADERLTQSLETIKKENESQLSALRNQLSSLQSEAAAGQRSLESSMNALNLYAQPFQGGVGFGGFGANPFDLSLMSMMGGPFECGGFSYGSNMGGYGGEVFYERPHRSHHHHRPSSVSHRESVPARVWVNGYTRSNGTQVAGYFRNSRKK